MAKYIVDPPFGGVRGALGNYVFKHYQNDKRGLVVSRRPDMSGVKPSAAQLAHRKRMQAAAAFHRAVLSDPVQLKKYRRIAREQRIPLSAATMAEVLRKK